jgi:selenium metabolism protein YedF
VTYKIDAQGLSCPQPVILTKKAMVDQKDITVLVDNSTAKENLFRLAAKENFQFEVTSESEGTISLHLYSDKLSVKMPIEKSISSNKSQGPLVYQITSEFMGSGSDELGSILMRALIHTISESDKKPEIIILYNSAVKLAIDESPVIDDLKELESKGIEIMVCGTCTNYFEISDNITVGIISNMYDILDTLNGAGHLVIP